MSFIDLFAKGQHSSMHLLLCSSASPRTEQPATGLFLHKYCIPILNAAKGIFHMRMPAFKEETALPKQVN